MFQFLSKFVFNNYSLLTPKLQSSFFNREFFGKILSAAKFSNEQNLNEKLVIDNISTFHGKSVINNIKNTLIKNEKMRLFAVVQLCGKQFKVTDGDIIIVQGYWPPTISDRIRLEKVLLLGGNNFTFIGTPILESEICDVQATIIEKTLSHTKTHFKKKRRKQYQRINFYRSQHTMLRINSININPNFNTNSNIEGDDRIKVF